MGVKLYFSNKLNSLVNQLSDDLHQLQYSVFKPELIVTQTEGMQQWVCMELAKLNSVFANFEFKKPNDIILHVAQLASVTEHYAMNTEKIKWILYFLLVENEFKVKFPQVSHYYQNADNADVKRMQLATKIADLFDQMVIYRPAYIKAWNENSLLNNDDETEQWQAYLWAQMRLKLDNPLDRTQLKDKLIFQLKNDNNLQELLQKSLPTISVFGLSILTQYHIEFFYEVSKYVDVNFYFLNPAPEQFWFDYKSEKEILRLKYKYKDFNSESVLVGNDLLTSWGKIGQDLYAELLAIDEFSNALESTETIEPERNTLLNIVKNEIFNNIPPNERENIDSKFLFDKSIQIISCHTEAREIEVLYNFLVKTISENQDISPSDILVMVPNIENYSPFIQSIFDNAPYKLPYALADRELQQSDELIAVLFSLLELTSFEFTSEKILQLIDYKIITNKYNITNPALIRRVVKEVNIRFGWGNTENELNSATETYLVSWQSGIERIVMGIAMKGGEMYNYNGKETLCYDALEGGDALELLNFIVFLKAIQNLIVEGIEERTLAEWRLYIQLIAEKLLDDNTEHEGLTQVLNRLDYIIELEELIDSKIPRNVFMQSINSIFNSNAANTGYLKGNITFCSTLPMRSIPFKVIAMLGMNSLDFPRQETPLGFDLIAKKPQKGDRNSKANDKYLFLEALLSTDNVFYLSYKGRSTKDNSHKEPSILIDELVNYIQQKSEIENIDKILITEHPLHAFSEKYFNAENDHLFTYFNFSENKNIVQFSETIHEKPLEKDIKLDAFINAIAKPINHYFNHKLGIYYNQDSLLVPENEAFELDKLKQFNFKNYLVSNELNEDFIKLEKHKGTIPLANAGKATLSLIDEEIAEYKSIYKSLVEDTHKINHIGIVQLSQLEIHFDIDLFLTLNGVEKQIIVGFSKDLASNTIRAWIKHLTLIASGKIIETQLISNNTKEEITLYHTTFNNQHEAVKLLQQFEEFYLKASAEIQVLVHKSAFVEWEKLSTKDANPQKLAENIAKKLKGENGDKNYNEYLQVLDSLNGIKDEFDEQFINSIDSIYNPIKQHFLNQQN